MLIARLSDGRYFSLLKTHDKEWLLKQREQTPFYCPICEAPLIMKLGEKKCYHFAHQQTTACHTLSEPETPTHIQGKKDFYHWLKEVNVKPTLEWYLPDIQQRADLGVPRFPKDMVLEYQCSTIPIEVLMERDKGYRSMGLEPIWIWDEKRLQRLGPQLFHITPLEWSTLQFPFLHLPHDSHQYKKGFLTFYNPSTKKITFLYHLIPLNSRRIWAEHLSIPLHDLSIMSLRAPTLKPTQPLLTSWLLKNKLRWRTARIPRNGFFEHTLNRLAEKKRVVWKACPGIIGLPVPDLGVIQTSMFQWQGWICLVFLVDQPLGSRFHWLEVQEAVMGLINKRWLVIQSRCDDRSNWQNVIKQYLKALIFFGYLKEQEEGWYERTQPLLWPEPFLDQFVQEDSRFLTEWLSVL